MNTEKKITRRIGKAIHDYRMIGDNDRIVIGVSGGKDSLALLHDLAERRRTSREKFELEALHIVTDIAEKDTAGVIENACAQLGVRLHTISISIRDALLPGQEPDCFVCSSGRRKAMLDFARAHGCNRVALGHHLDDIIETYLLNICFRGEDSGMLPSITYDREPSVTIIRPLALATEESIRSFVGEKGITTAACSCPYESRSMRRVMKEFIGTLARTNPLVRYNIFASMTNRNDRFSYGGKNE